MRIEHPHGPTLAIVHLELADLVAESAAIRRLSGRAGRRPARQSSEM
jgi:hypothetical protein